MCAASTAEPGAPGRGPSRYQPTRAAGGTSICPSACIPTGMIEVSTAMAGTRSRVGSPTSVRRVPDRGTGGLDGAGAGGAVVTTALGGAGSGGATAATVVLVVSVAVPGGDGGARTVSGSGTVLVDAGGGERRLERAPLAVGLDGRPRLARHDDDGAVQVGECRPHDIRVGGVEDVDGHPGGGADDLGGQRRPAHPAEDHAVVTGLGQFLAQGGDLTDEVA